MPKFFFTELINKGEKKEKGKSFLGINIIRS